MKLNEVNNVLTLKLVLSHQAEMLNSVQFKVNLKQPTVKQNNQGSLLFSTPCQMELAQTALSWERLCDVDEAKWNVALFRQIAAVAFALADVPKLDRSCVRIAVSLTESSNNVFIIMYHFHAGVQHKRYETASLAVSLLVHVLDVLLIFLLLFIYCTSLLLLIFCDISFRAEPFQLIVTI